MLVKYTLAGDANLDGNVDFADYDAVIGNFNSANQPWTSGCFDYTGNVGLAAYSTVLANFNGSLASVLPSIASPAVTASLATNSLSNANSTAAPANAKSTASRRRRISAQRNHA